MKKTFTILIVDDDPEIGIMLKIMLEHKGFSVIVLNNAEKLSETLSTHTIDVIILDMLIAGLNGTEISAILKKNPATSQYPIMIMTAMPDAELICRQSGANEFIAKPFEMDNFIAKINSLTVHL